jgi:flagellar biosynthesis anti-sigma factor FlgM
MKIPDISQKTQVLQYVNQQPKINANDQGTVYSGSSVQSQVGDRVDLSPSSKMIKKIEAAALSAPDTRAEKVAALKKKVESGTYQVDSNQVAGKMLKEFVVELNK